MMKFWIKLIHIVNQIFFPISCVGCRRPDILLCQDCDEKLTPSDNLDEQTITALAYSDVAVKQLVWLMKYRGSKQATNILAEKLHQKILYHLSDLPDFYLVKEKILLVPVPMTKKHERKRGWNQTKRLAEAMTELSPHTYVVSNALRKIRETKRQVLCQNKNERINNLKNCFELAPNIDLNNKIVIIIDDVTTTGATMAEAVRVLKESSPRYLYGGVVAHS